MYSHHPCIVGQTPRIEEIRETIPKIGLKNVPVLITGEPGTGKDLIAQAIHYHSSKNREPFVKIDFGLLPEDFSMESIFESQKRLFTETEKDKRDLFESVTGGTLFFDEIEKLSYQLQIEFRRILESKPSEKFEAIYERIKNMRFVFATKTTLKNEMQMGPLIEFLSHRLNVVHLELPPLRERKADIALLANFIIEKFNSRSKKEAFKMTDTIVNCLLKYQWPGNVKELENVIRQAIVTGTWNFYPGRLNYPKKSKKKLIARSKVAVLFLSFFSIYCV